MNNRVRMFGNFLIKSLPAMSRQACASYQDQARVYSLDIICQYKNADRTNKRQRKKHVVKYDYIYFSVLY